MSRKYKYGTNTHHRVPKFRKGTNDPSNLSVVCIMKHRAFHELFGVKTPEQIAEELNRKWIDPSKMLIVVDRNKKCESCEWKGDGLA